MILSYCHVRTQLPEGYDADKHMATLLEKINRKEASMGTKQSPALSCRDIYTCHGDSFKSGMGEYVLCIL